MNGEMMNFPDTAEEFMEQYKIVDSEEVYTNGAELVPIFRMEQWFKQHHEPHWIQVDFENNKPQLEEWVLVSSDGYVMQDCIVERGGKKIWYHGGNIQADDRYMPLPEPYKGVTE